MTIPTVPPRSRIRIGTTSIRVRIRHVLTGMIIGRRRRIGRVSPGMAREDGTTIRAAGQAMARVGDKANGNPAPVPEGDQVNLASRARVVPVEGPGNLDSLDRVAVRGSPVRAVSPANRGRADVRVSPANPSSRAKVVVRASPVSLSNRDRADVRVNPVSLVNLGKADVRANPVNPSSLGRADVRDSRASPVNLDRVVVRASPVSLSNLDRVAVRVSPASRSSRDRADVRDSRASRSSRDRVAVRGSPVSLVLARVPASRHSSPPGRKAPLPRPKSRSRDNRRSRDNQGSHLIRKDLVRPNNFWANLLS